MKFSQDDMTSVVLFALSLCSFEDYLPKSKPPADLKASKRSAAKKPYVLIVGSKVVFGDIRLREIQELAYLSIPCTMVMPMVLWARGQEP
jgi:hypothetical protein